MLLWFEGFETSLYGNGFARKYDATTGTMATTSPFSGQMGFFAPLHNRCSITKNLSFSGTVFSGFRFQSFGASLTAATCFRLIEGSTTHISVGVDTSNRLCLYLGDRTTTLVTGPTVATNIWKYLEIEAVISDSGSVKVYLDDVEVISYTGNTKNGGSGVLTGVILGKESVGLYGGGYCFDDWYVADSSGTGVTTRLGSGACVYPITANAAGDSTQWTPSGGANYQCVDEDAYTGDMYGNQDASYIAATSAGLIDLFNAGSLSVAADEIYGVAVIAHARNDDGSSDAIKVKLKSGSTTETGPSKATTKDYGGYVGIWTTDPDTGLSWDTAGVNALQIGVES